VVQQNRDCAGLRVWPGGAEIMHVWIPGLAGLRGAGLQSGYCVGLCRPGWGGYGSAERRLCVCGSQAWQALGASRIEKFKVSFK
jgi:hypothetical protein